MRKFNFYLGASVSAWLLTFLIIAAELSEPLKTSLKTAFSHHWIGKIVFVILAFFVFGYLLRKRNSIGKFSDSSIAWYSMLGGIAVVLLFFIAEFFG